jgi:hypothetical protein
MAIVFSGVWYLPSMPSGLRLSPTFGRGHTLTIVHDGSFSGSMVPG